MRVCWFFVSLAVKCSELEDPMNGRVNLEEQTYPSKADYRCNDGFDLVGDSHRTCQADGSWSGNAPFCECKFHGSYFLYTNTHWTYIPFMIPITKHYLVSLSFKIMSQGSECIQPLPENQSYTSNCKAIGEPSCHSMCIRYDQHECGWWRTSGRDGGLD